MSDDFAAVFTALRELMLMQAPGGLVTKDEPGDLVVKTPTPVGGSGEPAWFGAVTIKRSYVAYHLMPLYDRPDLAHAISPELEKRRQGKTCFNFKRADPGLFEELGQLTAAAASVR